MHCQRVAGAQRSTELSLQIISPDAWRSCGADLWQVCIEYSLFELQQNFMRTDDAMRVRAQAGAVTIHPAAAIVVN